jgi:ABC-type dipeptide/oligopeptide/nickel transport system ATPase component
MSDATAQQHHVITRLRVSGGFLAGADLEFSGRLNCFIGGRGTGKTTALEFLRFALGLLPDAKIHSQRRRALESLIDYNLSSGRLSIDVSTRTGIRYTAERGSGDSIVVRNSNGDVVPVSLDRDEIFSVDVFSQNEIEEIASNTAAQLELLDRFDESNSKRVGRDLIEIERALAQSGSELRRLDDEIDALRAQASEVAGIEEKLKGLTHADGPHADRIAAAHQAKATRMREAQVPDAILAAIQRAARDAIAIFAGLRGATAAQFEPAHSDDTNIDLSTALRGDVEQFAAAVEKAISAIDQAARRAVVSIEGRRLELATRHAVQEADYASLLTATRELSDRAMERETLQVALAAAQSAERELRSKSSEREVGSKSRGDLLRRLSEARDDRFNRRRAVAARLSAEFQTLRVTVRQAANLEAYRAFLSEELKGLRLKQGIASDRITTCLLPSELATLVLRNAPEGLVAQTGLDLDRCRRIIDALRESGAAYSLELIDLGDVPSIELRDVDTYKEASRLSTGQRCTVILPILLKQSQRPLLIDQPEDNLDNAFVFEAVVSALRSVKDSRQVIFVTHNPNIPVLGDADRVFVFQSDGQHASIAQAGTVDECKEAVERILEGGPAAFVERMKRYGH